MKITLNLLPEERKKEINNKKAFMQAIKQSVLFLLPVICLLAVLIVINFILEINLESQNKASAYEQNQNQYKKLKEYESNFARMNTKTAILLNIEKKHFFWSNVLKELDETVPENVNVTGIANRDFQLSISGKAKTREDFLKFKDSLSGADCFENITAPLSNLVEKKDVIFQVDFGIKENCLYLTE